MAKHPFAKSAIKGLQKAHEDAVFALNIPMSNADREEVRKHIQAAHDIINKY